MITLKEWMELVDYRISEGSDYNMYSTNAYALSSGDGEYYWNSFEIIFDTETQVVYCVEACDYRNDRAYRLINPDYALLPHDSQAWDEVDWTNLEVDDDFMQKVLSIKSGEAYDTRISVPLTMSDDEMLVLYRMAHEADMTLNQYVESMLKCRIDDQQEKQMTLEDWMRMR